MVTSFVAQHADKSKALIGKDNYIVWRNKLNSLGSMIDVEFVVFMELSSTATNETIFNNQMFNHN